MIASKHLTDEALIFFIGERLTTDDRDVVGEHLRHCLSCRRRCEKLKITHRVFERISEVGLHQLIESDLQSGLRRPKTSRLLFPWAPVAGILGACLCTLAVLFYPHAVPAANAAALLADAVRQEDHSQDTRRFRLQVGNTTCTTGQADQALVFLDHSSSCTKALMDLKEANWASGDLLSAKRFRDWHDSLRDFHDSVVHQAAFWKIQTETGEGPIRLASLDLDSEHRATGLALRFQDEEELTVSDDEQSLHVATAEKTSETAPRAVHVDDPADLLEVIAWRLLYKLKADSGWEATVIRDGGTVKVKAVVESEQRKQELIVGYNSYPKIAFDVLDAKDVVALAGFFPQRLLPGSGPPLAEQWLRSEFPGDETRKNFENQTLGLSRDLLGRVVFVRALESRRAALSRCSCAKDLTGELVVEQQAQNAARRALAAALESLIGIPDRSTTRPLTEADAQHLDYTIQALLLGSSPDMSLTLESATAEIRHLLFPQANFSAPNSTLTTLRDNR